jgi:hypothetical protein
MSQESNEVTRRAFAKAAVAAVAVPVLAPLAACAGSPPESAPAPQPAPPAAQPDSAAAQPQEGPTPLARALADAIRVQYGDRMTDAEMAKVQRSISGVLRTAEQLRRFELPIATEPSFVYRVPGGAA